jgi:hypothetical protein
VGFGTGNFSGYGPIFSELFPTALRSTAMGEGISIGALFAVFTGLWVWTLPETKGTKIGAWPGVSGSSKMHRPHPLGAGGLDPSEAKLRAS